MADVTLEGEILRVLFRNPESLYTVARLGMPEGEITATGPFLEIVEGDRYRLTGTWTQHAKYGRQFAVQEAQRVLPDTASGIEAYLASGLFKGIGPKLARRLVDHFGDATLDILLREPDRVCEVPGVGPAKRQTLVESLGEYGRVQSLALFLQGHGVSLTLTMKIHQRYGENAIKLVQENPYRLAAEVEGIGFLTADEIARKIGTNPAAPERIRAAVQHVLTERSEAEGHVFLPAGELLARSLAFLNKGAPAGVQAQQVREAVTHLVDEGLLVRDEGDLIYRRELYEAEADLAERILALLDRTPDLPSERLTAIVDDVEAKLGVEYAPEQRAAVITALQSPVAVITGGPGTGKSTVLRGVMEALRRVSSGSRVLLAAPTGRAARRMTDVTGEPARTIHRLLGYNPVENGFLHDESEPLQGDVLVVDEFSMVDLNLAAALFAAIPSDMRVLLVGDADQLPSVGTGNVLADLIGCGAVPVVRLTHIFRQAVESKIVLNAHRINAGQMPDLRPADDFEFVIRDEPLEIVRYIRDRAVAARDAGAALDQITVLTPMRKTETGVESLNKILQEALNPARRRRPEAALGSVTFRLGDKVMQRKNNYEKEVFNGSVGAVTAIKEDDDELVVTFEDDLVVEYRREELDQLTLAYACTVHKAQGSEYTGLVLIPVTMQHAAMLQRNLLYTALTRARQKAVLVGTEAALGRAVYNNRIARRYSRLGARLRGEAPRLDLPALFVAPPVREPERPAACVIYLAARERKDGACGWAAVRVTVGGDRQDWSGARSGVSSERLQATALGIALQGLSPEVAVVVCSEDQALLERLEQDSAAPAEVLMVREALGVRVWRPVPVGREDAMLLDCLRLALAAETPEVAADAAARRATAIGTLGDAAKLPELHELLRHEAPVVRRAAAGAAGKLKQKESLEHLLPLLGDTSPQVRQAVLGALEKIGPDERFLEPLNDLLLREEKEASRKAAESLLRLLLKGRRR